MGKGEEGGRRPALYNRAGLKKGMAPPGLFFHSLNFILRTHVPVCLRPADQAGGDVIYT